MQSYGNIIRKYMKMRWRGLLMCCAALCCTAQYRRAQHNTAYHTTTTPRLLRSVVCFWRCLRFQWCGVTIATNGVVWCCVVCCAVLCCTTAQHTITHHIIAHHTTSHPIIRICYILIFRRCMNILRYHYIQLQYYITISVYDYTITLVYNYNTVQRGVVWWCCGAAQHSTTHDTTPSHFNI